MCDLMCALMFDLMYDLMCALMYHLMCDLMCALMYDLNYDLNYDLMYHLICVFFPVCVKGTASSADTNVYFAKCVVFLKDNEGKIFVVLHWFDRQEKDNGFDTISNVPSFKLTPNEHTKSYSILPISCIVNGAFMVPGGGRFWALLSPKEHKRYALNFH